MNITCRTKSGAEVTLTGSPSKLATIVTPVGTFTGHWGTLQGNDGFIGKCVVDGVEKMICAQIPKIEWDHFCDGIRLELSLNVPGLNELIAAHNAEEKYADDFNAMMDDENNDGVNPPTRPTVKSSELAKQYPIAAAYLKAESWECSSHHVKSSEGRKAKNIIAEGGYYANAITAMEINWSNYCAGVVD